MASYELRAMSLGEILDAAFVLYRRLFGVLVGISVVCNGLHTVVGVYMNSVGVEFVNPMVPLLYMLLLSLGGLLAAGATIWVVSQVYLGMSVDITSALRFAFDKMFKIFVAGLAKYLVIFLVFPTAAFVVGVIIFAVVGDLTVAAVIIALVSVACLAGSFVIASGFAVVTQTAVLEDDVSATDALPRSWRLTRGFRLKAFAMVIVLAVLVTVPGALAGVLALVIPSLAALMNGIGGLLQLMVYPVAATAFTLLYYDLRVRNEAFDLEHLGQQLGLTVMAE